MNKIFFITFLLLSSVECNMQNKNVKSNDLPDGNVIIFNYVGISDKAIPAVIISDSDLQHTEYKYFKFFKISSDLLIALKKVIVEDKNLLLSYSGRQLPLYEITIKGNIKKIIYTCLTKTDFKKIIFKVMDLLKNYKNTEQLQDTFSDIIRRVVLIS